MSATFLYQQEAHGNTARNTADRFAASYWDRPRKVRGMDADGRFRVEDGRRVYRVVRQDGPIPVYQIIVEAPND